ANQIGRQFRQPTDLIVRPPIFDRYVLALNVAHFTQTSAEWRHVTCALFRRTKGEIPDHRHRRLLRPRRERPRSSNAAEQRDELAALQLRDHSMTSSARASNVDGTSRPSALAVLRLITSWYLVGSCTGRSAGFSPFRMRST